MSDPPCLLPLVDVLGITTAQKLSSTVGTPAEGTTAFNSYCRA